MMRPRVSIGLPVYNGERYLRESIESLLTQTYTDFEFIIVDNASSDNTEEICREYANLDERIRYHRNETNIGAPRNFNKAFQLSSGTYLKWATADDYVAREMIQKCVAVLDERSDVVLCYPRANLIDAQGEFLARYDDVLDLAQSKASDRFIHLLRNIKLAHHHLGLIRTDLLRRTSLHHSHIAADINFLAELSLYGKFYELPEYLLFRRFHPGSSSWDRKSQTRQVIWSDPGRSHIRLDAWEATWNFFTAAARSPAPLRQKMQIYKFLALRAYWRKQQLGGELADAIRASLRRTLP